MTARNRRWGKAAQLSAARRLVKARWTDAKQIRFPLGRARLIIAAMLKDTDVLLNVPYPRTARIQENHILLIHAMCDCIDSMLLEGM